MVLTSGARLGPYKIQSALGAGGMGEVYRARDTKLGRDVAVKILPDSFAVDPERVTRFRREAQMLAALNHPHIAAIHGLEESGTTQFLVLELVDGETLAERLKRGPLPVEEVLTFARQLADALEAAHEKGVIHRDLKPANIALTVNDQVKVLDFGLAKAFDPVLPSDPSNSPTLTVHATQAGVILGTAAYMAPEQARGKSVDKRADIWAFGCVLYEMLTAVRAFDGEDVAETLGAVFHKEPAWTALPPDTPSAVRKLLRRCLEKDPKRRLHDIADARIELEDVAGGSATDDPVGLTPGGSFRSSFLYGGWIAASLFAGVAAALGWLYLREAALPSEQVRFPIFAPPQTTFVGSPILSPDGRQLAFTARGQDGRTRLWIRPFDSVDARLLPGTEEALDPVFWSPDSRFIGFAVVGNSLKKVDVRGQPPVTLCERCEATSGFGIRGGAWNRDGTIVYAVRGRGLWRLPESGGVPRQVGAVDDYGAYPTFLPDGRHFLYTRLNVGSAADGIVLGSIDSTAEPTSRLLVPGVFGPGYAPSSDPDIGYLLFVRDGTLMAQRFDARRLRLLGEAEPLAEYVPTATPAVAFSASATGALAFKSSRSADMSKLAWFDREGKDYGAIGLPGWYGNVNFSPDRKTLVIDRIEPEKRARHVWSVDIGREAFSRPVADGTEDYAPAVSSDGRVAFTSGNDLYIALANGAARPELLFKSPSVKHSNGWSPDGRFLIFDDHHATQQQDLWILRLTDRKPVPLLTTAADEAPGHFSPDGKWVAYGSNESGRREIYIRDFAPDRIPAVGSFKRLISTQGGDKPRWGPDGKELYYIAPDGNLMAVPIRMTPTLELGIPVALFDIKAPRARSFFPYDVAANRRFLINMDAEGGAASSPITVVLNWMSGLRK